MNHSKNIKILTILILVVFCIGALSFVLQASEWFSAYNYRIYEASSVITAACLIALPVLVVILFLAHRRNGVATGKTAKTRLVGKIGAILATVLLYAMFFVSSGYVVDDIVLQKEQIKSYDGGNEYYIGFETNEAYSNQDMVLFVVSKQQYDNILSMDSPIRIQYSYNKISHVHKLLEVDEYTQ